MKLKYYLRGLGVGLLVTTIILTISNGIRGTGVGQSNTNSKNENETKGSVIAYTQSETKNDNQKETTKNEVKETVKATDKAETKATEKATEKPTEKATEAATTVVAKETQPATEAVPAPEPVPQVTPTPVPGGQYADRITFNGDGTSTIFFYDVKTGTIAANLLYEAGVISDVPGFVDYLSSTGYAYKIKQGYYTIRHGEDYAVICSIISRGE